DIIFVDSQRLLNHTRVAGFKGVKVRTLEPYAEALTAASHAIYKEHIHTLNDHFTVKNLTMGRSFMPAG
ncbi:MAG: hypothetical protein FGF50_04260, partial [Candidatus Brockarchaeota archaeon]|nr:hypothetical protein [Candidatus Brockarchaeota archaeon]